MPANDKALALLNVRNAVITSPTKLPVRQVLLLRNHSVLLKDKNNLVKVFSAIRLIN